MVGERTKRRWGGEREERWGTIEGENSGVEGVGQYFAGRPSPLDVLMHVENNLTANLLHSFSFLPGSPLRSTLLHPFTVGLTYRTLPFVPFDFRVALSVPSSLFPSSLSLFTTRLPFFFVRSRRCSFLLAVSQLRGPGSLARNRIRNLNF